MPPPVFPPKCDFKMADGTDCPIPAAHFWGTVHSCCTHFEQFVLTLIRVDKLPENPQHLEIVHEYNRQCGRDSLIPGTHCESEKKREP